MPCCCGLVPCCVAGVCSMKTPAECAAAGGTTQAGTECTCSTCGTRPVWLPITIEQTYSTDVFSYTFAPHYGTMVGYTDMSAPPGDFFRGTHRYQAAPNFSGNPVYLSVSAYARLELVGNQLVFVLLQAAEVQFDPSISYQFYGCTVRGSYGGSMYAGKNRFQPNYGRTVLTESCEGKTKDNLWDWLIGKQFIGDDWTQE